MVHEVSCTNVQRTSRLLLCVKDHHQDRAEVFFTQNLSYFVKCVNAADKRTWEEDVRNVVKSEIAIDHRVSDPCRNFRSAKAGWFVTELHLSLSERRRTLPFKTQRSKNAALRNQITWTGRSTKSLWTQIWCGFLQKQSFSMRFWKLETRPNTETFRIRQCAREERQREEEKQEAEWMTERLMKNIFNSDHRSYADCAGEEKKKRGRKEEKAGRKGWASTTLSIDVFFLR